MTKNTEKFDNSLGACLKSFWTEYVGWGRATRSEYWWSVLFYSILASSLLGNTGLGGIWTLVILVPTFTVAARRWHDINKSAWNMLWIFLPVIGWIISIVYLCQPSTPKNQFGEPKIKTNSVKTNAQKNTGLYIVLGIVISILCLSLVYMNTSSVETTIIETKIEKNKITLFESAADCVSKGYIEVQEVLDSSTAIARTQSDIIGDKILYYGKDVVITNKKGKTYYDKQEIKAPNCFRQIGIYKDGYRTLPVVEAQ